MAKVNTGSNSSVKLETSKVSRPGIHSKTKTSKLKQSKNYKKSYKGQGKSPILIIKFCYISYYAR